MPATTTVPQGYYWLKELVPQAQWDEPTRTIKLPGGPSIPLSSTLAVGGKAYATPEQLRAWYATYYQPPSAVYTPENVQRQAEVFRQLLEPQAAYYKDYLDFALKKATETAEQQRRSAEAAYQAARSALERQETGSWNAIMKSAIARGLGASPLASYEQRKVAEAYAPEYQQLETNRAATLANIASQAALAADELALKGREMEANWASQMAQYALSELAKEYEQQQGYRERMADYFGDVSEQEAKAQEEAAKLAWEKEKAYLPYLYPTANTLVPYKYGPTPYQQSQLGLRAQELAFRQQQADLPKTDPERRRIATSEMYKSALNLYQTTKEKQKKESGGKGNIYPLYYTISALLMDSKWRNAAMNTGADMKAVVDSLIYSIAKTTPEQYFTVGKGTELRSLYESVTGQKFAAGESDLRLLSKKK